MAAFNLDIEFDISSKKDDLIKKIDVFIDSVSKSVDKLKLEVELDKKSVRAVTDQLKNLELIHRKTVARRTPIVKSFTSSDMDSIKSMALELRNLEKTQKQVGKFKVPSIKSAVISDSKEISKATSQIHKYISARKKMNATVVSDNTTEHAKGAEKEIKDKTKSTIAYTKAKQESIEVDKQSSKAKTDIRQKENSKARKHVAKSSPHIFSDAELTPANPEVSKNLTKVNNLISTIRKNSKNWISASSGESSSAYFMYERQADALERIRKQLLEGKIDVDSFADAMGEISRKADLAASEMGRIGGITKTVSQNKDKYIDKIDKKIAAAQNEVTRLSYINDPKSKDLLEDYKKKIETMSKFRQYILKNSEKISVGEADTTFKSLSSSMDDTLAAMKLSEKQLKNYTKMNNLEAEIRANSKKWSAASVGDTSDTYDVYVSKISDIEDLRKALLSGSITAKDFNIAFERIKAEAAEAASEIQRLGRASELVSQNQNKVIEKINQSIIKSKKDFDIITKYETDSNKDLIDEYIEQMNEMKSFKKDVENDNGTMSMNEAMERYNLINSKLSDTSFKIKDSDANIKNLIEINDLISEISVNSKNWSAASVGDTKNAYDAYVGQIDVLKELEERMKNGSISAEELRRSINGVVKVMKTSSSEMKASGKATKLASDIQDEAASDINRMVSDIMSKSNKWTKAKYGKSKDTYKEYVGLVDKAQDLFADAMDKNNGMTDKDFISHFKSLASAKDKYESEIIRNNEDKLSTFDKVSGITKRLMAWASATNVIMTIVDGLKRMAQATVEVESAMNQIKIVTGATDSQMSGFLSKSTSLAKELGKSITDVASSVETFSRLGYGLEDSSTLAKYANILSNVAAVDTETATTGITSIIKGYGLDVKDTEHVADVLVKVGQEYAISAEELMTAFERGGAALNATGTSFEQSAGLFAATNAALQNAESVGTMWKTVSARIRGAKADLEDMGEDTVDVANGLSKYRAEIQSLSGGVDIMVNDTTYKDIFTIFVELARVWDKISSDQSRTRIAEILGGNRQYSGVMSTINNISDAIGAYEGAINDSANVANMANEKYMETAKAHIGELKAAFQEMATVLIDNGAITSVIDAGISIMEVATSLTKFLRPLTDLKAILVAISAITFNRKFEVFKKGGEALLNLKGRVVDLKSTFTDAFNSVVSSGGKTSDALKSGFSSAVKSISTSFTSLKSKINLAFVAIEAALIAYNIMEEKARKDRERHKEQYDKTSESANKSLGMREDIAVYSRYSSQTNLTSTEEVRLNDAIDNIVDSMGEKSNALAGLTKGTEEYNRVLDKQIETELKASSTEFEKSKYAAGKVLSDVKRRLFEPQDGIGDRSHVSLKVDQFGVFSKVSKEDKKRFKEIIDGLLANNDAIEHANKYINPSDLGDPNSIAAYIKSLESLYNQMSEAGLSDIEDIYDPLSDIISTYGSDADNYITGLVNSLISKYESESGGIPKTLEEFYNMRSSIMEEFSKSMSYDGDEEDIDRILSSIPMYKEFISEITAVENKVGGNNGNLANYVQTLSKLKTVVESLGTHDQTISDVLNSSNSALGVTAEQVDTLMSAYSNIKGVNVEDLFDYPDDGISGIRINKEELERVEELYRNSHIKEFQKKIAALEVAIDKAKKTGKDTSALESELFQVRLLQSEYDSLTSAYNKWSHARSNGHERDVFTDISSSFKEMKEIYDSGWYGDDSLGAYLDVLISKSKRTGDVAKDFYALSQTIDGTKHNILDYFKPDENGALDVDGVFDFVEDVKNVFGEGYASIDDNGLYSLNLDKNKTAEIASRFGMSTEAVEALNRALKDTGGIATQSAAKIKSLFGKMISHRDDVLEAIKESNSSTGLTSEQIDKLSKSYEDLESYNPELLFEKTADGVQLNRKELERLEKIYSSTRLNEYKNKIVNLQNAIADSRSRGEDTAPLEKELYQLELLRSQYEGLASSYNNWIRAKESGSKRDMYQNVSSSYEDMKNLFDAGWLSDNGLNAYIDMLVDGGKLTGDMYKDFMLLDNTIAGTSNSISDYFSVDKDGTLETDGVFKFFQDVKSIFGEGYASVNDSGEFEFNLDDTKIDNIASKFGMTSQSVRMLRDALEDTGGVAYETSSHLEAIFDTFKNHRGIVDSALSSSRSAVGLTTEEIDSLIDTYSDLEEYDPDKLFERTANGIHLQEEELSKLEAAYAKVNFDDFDNKIRELQASILNAHASGEDTSALENELTRVELLKSQYEGLTSSYNNWIRAKSSANDRDSYESVGASRKEMQDILNAGWYGDDSLNAYLDLLLSDRTDNAIDDFERLGQVIEGTNHSLMDYWSFDDNDKLNTDGLFNFLDDVNAKLGDAYAVRNSDGTYDFDFDDGRLKEVADAFGTTTQMVELFERALIDTGKAFYLNDDALTSFQKLDDIVSNLKDTSLEDLKSTLDSLNEARLNVSEDETPILAEQLDEVIEKVNEEYKLRITADSSVDDTKDAIEETNGAASELSDTIGSMKTASLKEIKQVVENIDTASMSDLRDLLDNLKDKKAAIRMKIDPEGKKEIDDLITKCEKEYYLRIDASSNGQLSQAAGILDQIWELKKDPLTIIPTVSHDEEIEALIDRLATMDRNVQISIGIKEENVGNAEAILSQFTKYPLSIEVPVNFTPVSQMGDSSEISADGVVNYTTGTVEPIKDQEAKVNYSTGFIEPIPLIVNRSIVNHVTTVHDSGKDEPGFSGGTALLNGYNAYARGVNWSLPANETALVNEVGTESIVRDGRWFTLPGGAHMEQLKRGDIVFSAAQTQELVKYGKVFSGSGHGYVARADGTAYNTLNMGAYHRGSPGGRRPSVEVNVIPGASGGSSGGYSGYAGSGSASSKDYATEEAEDKFEELFDFIEIALDRVSRAIDRVKVVAESAYQTLSVRNNALCDEMDLIAQQIDIQSKAYNRYIEEANSVGLSESWAKWVRDGAIDITLVTDESLAKQIKDYQDFYEKALDAKDAIAELKEEISNLYEDRFGNLSSEFENRIDLLEHLTETYDQGLSKLEEQGYLASAKYYESMRDVEKEKVSVQKEQLQSLIDAMSDAVNSGAIEKGSEAWYDMQQDINDTKEAIQESETAIIEFGNSIREVKWDQFDYLQDQISQITDESDFLIDLMESDNLFDDKGKITDTGKATMGLHGQNYNVYMAQADKYAKEIERINSDIANDPNNTKLLERRQELLEAQRESILSAEDEKEAIVDLVEDGINKELESLQDLIDTYNESLDSAKDLYDYQKNIEDQTSEIARLKKQLLAYSNDTSEESRATIQKLEVDLSDAMEKLEETQYDKYVSDQKQLLDDLYEEYETILNQRLDNIDALISDVINGVNDSAVSIGSTIVSESDKVGYTLTDSMNAIWSNEGGAFSIITKYGDTFTNAFTSVNSVLNSISSKLSTMIGESNEAAGNTIEGSSQTTEAAPAPTPPAPTPPPAPPVDNSAPAITVGSTINAGNATIYAASNGSGAGSQYYSYDPLYTVIGEQNGYWKVRWHNLSSGITGWFWKPDVTAYKTGGLADFTGLAQLDGTPSEPELVLNAKDTKNFIALKDALRTISDRKLSVSDILAGNTAAANITESLSKIDPKKINGTTNIDHVMYQVNIPIDHVLDYKDFMNQMRKDGKFEDFIKSFTVDALNGGSKLSKNKYIW